MKRYSSVYVGCALTYASEDFKQNVSDLKERLKEVCVVLEFIGLLDGTARDVYHHDINNNVRNCDLFVAICDQASIGLGCELVLQIEDRKMPALAVAQLDSKVTRLVLGIDSVNFKFKRYRDFDDLYEIILEKLKNI